MLLEGQVAIVTGSGRGLDVLVNNARAHLPSGELGPFATVQGDAWQEFMRTNLGGLFYCTQRAAALMVARRRD